MCWRLRSGRASANFLHLVLLSTRSLHTPSSDGRWMGSCGSPVCGGSACSEVLEAIGGSWAGRSSVGRVLVGLRRGWQLGVGVAAVLLLAVLVGLQYIAFDADFVLVDFGGYGGGGVLQGAWQTPLGYHTHDVDDTPEDMSYLCEAGSCYTHVHHVGPPPYHDESEGFYECSGERCGSGSGGAEEGSIRYRYHSGAVSVQQE